MQTISRPLIAAAPSLVLLESSLALVSVLSLELSLEVAELPLLDLASLASPPPIPLRQLIATAVQGPLRLHRERLLVPQPINRLNVKPLSLEAIPFVVAALVDLPLSPLLLEIL